MITNQQIEMKAKWINRMLVLLILIILVLVLTREFSSYKQSVAFNNERIYDLRLHAVEHEVSNRVDEIESIKLNIQKEFEDTLKEKVTIVNYFASLEISELPNDATLEEKREVFVDAIYQYDISEDEYLFFAMDLQGKSYLSGLTKNLEGTDISFLEDPITGEFFVLDMIEIINNSENNQGFTTYNWPKEVDGQPMGKTSFIYYNEEAQLFFGTGLYDDDYLSKIQTELVNRINEYYVNSEDYIYIIGYDGEIILHENADFSYNDLMIIQTSDGLNFHEATLERLENDDGILVEYFFDFNKPNQLKTGYIQKIPDWDMYIGMSFINEELGTEGNQYIDEILPTILLYNAFVVFIVSIFSYILYVLIKATKKSRGLLFVEKNEMIKKLAFRDALTDCFNRSYYVDAISKISMDIVTVIMVDANGLKLINDGFGHETGDKLLISISDTLKELFSEYIIFRWGGDEFLLLGNEDLEVEEKIKLFNESLSNKLVKGMSISAALGYKTGKSTEIDKLIIDSESKMYEEKTKHTFLNKRNVVNNILELLYSSSDYEKTHSENVEYITSKISKELSLDEEDTKTLRLCSIIHDVGKISVPRDILDKNGKLTEAEYSVIKQHVEKGYRIVATYPHLTKHAEIILHHHERMDGEGYPQGLLGKDIPLLSRIITVADAYDAMTAERPYKKPMKKEAAINELKRCSGTHFDPKIVDAIIKIIPKL